MDFPILAVALLALLATVMEFVPVVNVVTELVSSGDPSWWKFALKAGETIAFLQLVMPFLENLTIKTANTWDDGLLAKFAMILAFAAEIMGALGAFDPQLGRRIKAITGPRRTHG